ncbi:MAG TPA: hypothetical protein VIV11_30745 [Kofleriaceae bacterium]
MRTSLFIAALGLLSMAGCAWSEFDDLADTTWVRSTDEPNVGSRNYALAIVGLTTGTSGGQLGVVSDDTPDYSTIDYDNDGTDTAGGNDVKLGQHRIAALTDPPLFVTDGNGKIAIAERSTTGGNVAVVFGSATAPAGIEFAALAPDAVTFVGADVVVAAGDTFYTLQTAMQVPCKSMDSTFAVAAMALDSATSTLWVWSKSGAFFGIPSSALTPCNGGMLPSAGSTLTTPLMPAAGARVHIVGNFAVLTAHAPTSRMGQIFVVDLSTVAESDTLAVEGLRSSAVAVFGTTTYVVIGVPDRAVGGVVAGQVDLFALDTTAGTLTKTPALSLNDAQAESGQLFGRAVTTMKFNDKQILVIAANSEVFAYYKTALYDALP